MSNSVPPDGNVPVADVTTAKSVPSSCDGLIVAVKSTGTVPRQAGLSRSALVASGFEGKLGQTLAIPGGSAPRVVVVGAGDDTMSTTAIRDAAAAGLRAFGNRIKHVGILFGDATSDANAVQAATEGALLASYRYVGLKSDTSIASKLNNVTIVVAGKAAKVAEQGAAAGRITARAQCLARELANTPPDYLNAVDLANLAVQLGPENGLTVEVYNADQLEVLGCGGMLGVNRGSAQPPRMVRLEYKPPRPKASVAMVGKGVMYDSGGISLKPSNESHGQMKMDMSGAAAVLSTMLALADLGCRNRVTAWLMCTDNMPSGTALKLGDVLTIRNGTTVEVLNTDAEGRLVLADGLSLATEADPDVIVDIATLTGAAMGALGNEIAAVLGNDDHAVARAKQSSAATDEPIWELPLASDRYRKLLDSEVADLKNIGGPLAGTITAAIFLSQFVASTPWVHIDMAGPMSVSSDSGWKSKGATGFGTRLLIDFVTNYTA